MSDQTQKKFSLKKWLPGDPADGGKEIEETPPVHVGDQAAAGKETGDRVPSLRESEAASTSQETGVSKPGAEIKPPILESGLRRKVKPEPPDPPNHEVHVRPPHMNHPLHPRKPHSEHARSPLLGHIEKPKPRHDEPERNPIPKSPEP